MTAPSGSDPGEQWQLLLPLQTPAARAVDPCTHRHQHQSIIFISATHDYIGQQKSDTAAAAANTCGQSCCSLQHNGINALIREDRGGNMSRGSYSCFHYCSSKCSHTELFISATQRPPCTDWLPMRKSTTKIKYAVMRIACNERVADQQIGAPNGGLFTLLAL
jgi:hypothetical protein